MNINYRWQLLPVILLYTIISGGFLWTLGCQSLVIATWSSATNDSPASFLRLGFLFGMAQLPGKAFSFIWNGILEGNISWSMVLWAFSIILAVASVLSGVGTVCYISWFVLAKPKEQNFRLSNLYLLCTSTGALLTCAVTIYCIHLHKTLYQYGRVVGSRKPPVFRFGSAFFVILGLVALAAAACIILVLLKLERLLGSRRKAMTPARSTPLGPSISSRFGCDACSFSY